MPPPKSPHPVVPPQVPALLPLTSAPRQPRVPLLLSRMREVAKVFLATNSDYAYTDVSTGRGEEGEAGAAPHPALSLLGRVQAKCRQGSVLPGGGGGAARLSLQAIMSYLFDFGDGDAVSLSPAWAGPGGAGCRVPSVAPH